MFRHVFIHRENASTVLYLITMHSISRTLSNADVTTFNQWRF